MAVTVQFAVGEGGVPGTGVVWAAPDPDANTTDATKLRASHALSIVTARVALPWCFFIAFFSPRCQCRIGSGPPRIERSRASFTASESLVHHFVGHPLHSSGGVVEIKIQGVVGQGLGQIPVLSHLFHRHAL